MKFLTIISQFLAISATGISQYQSNGESVYGTFDTHNLPKALGQHQDPWGGASPGQDIPFTGVIRKYNLSVSREYKSPDGYNKSVILINDQFPGPLIQANWGDTIQVTVFNGIKTVAEGLTLHWHGQPQRSTPLQDGTPGISQCPIAPESSLTYTFRAENFGTGWYHSHVSGQYTDGLYGPMVIYGPTQLPYDIDLGPVMLSDYNHQNYFDILQNAFVGSVPIIDNNLINGKGVVNCTRYSSLSCKPNSNLSTFTFEYGKVHRLRLINTGNDGTQKFSIDNHKLTVIANDYVPVQPYKTDTVTLAVGQRTDVLVNGTEQGAYWMRSDFDTSCLNLTAYNNHALAVVRYSGVDTSLLPNSTGTPWQSNNCGNDPLEQTTPYYQSKSNATSNLVQVFNITLRPNATGKLNFFVNGSSFEADYNSPILLDAMRGRKSFPKARNVYSYPKNLTIRAIFETMYAVAHPIHLHGHDFRVLAEGYGHWDGKVQGNALNPQRRDTQLLLRPQPDGQPSYMVIEWTTDNAGVWPLHCHTSIHVSAGLAINILEDVQSFQNTTVPANVRENCLKWAEWSQKNMVDQIDSGI